MSLGCAVVIWGAPTWAGFGLVSSPVHGIRSYWPSNYIPSFLQDWQVQCEQYVTLYGPLFINMLITYLQPDAICTELGYCPASFLA